ncbi:MAG: BlaI/MecI/CopY family transcriptional regulator [Planctomycetales bacterium]|nr:BlaI/MecI/CopY family transcriptional regulator [Planctomycetales bacterium]
MAKQRKPALSDLENKVMAIVWAQEQCSADDVRTQLKGAASLKDSTVRTILRRLEQKGYVTHRTEARTYFYSPIVQSQHVAAEAVQGIVQRLCNGSVEDLLVGLVDSEVLSAEKLSELAKKISNAKAKDQAKSKTRRPKGV